MFNNENDRDKLLVEMNLSDGRVFKGNLLVVKSSTLSRTLNNDSQFLEFESMEGTVRMIAKKAISDVRSIDMPKPIDLGAKTERSDTDPYRTLGLAANAAPADIHDAYIRMSKIYHPDKFSGADFPKEIMQYLDSKIRAINAAHELLTGKSAKAAA